MELPTSSTPMNRDLASAPNSLHILVYTYSHLTGTTERGRSYGPPPTVRGQAPTVSRCPPRSVAAPPSRPPLPADTTRASLERLSRDQVAQVLHQRGPGLLK